MKTIISAQKDNDTVISRETRLISIRDILYEIELLAKKKEYYDVEMVCEKNGD